MQRELFEKELIETTYQKFINVRHEKYGYQLYPTIKKLMTQFVKTQSFDNIWNWFSCGEETLLKGEKLVEHIKSMVMGGICMCFSFDQGTKKRAERNQTCAWFVARWIIDNKDAIVVKE